MSEPEYKEEQYHLKLSINEHQFTLRQIITINVCKLFEENILLHNSCDKYIKLSSHTLTDVQRNS